MPEIKKSKINIDEIMQDDIEIRIAGGASNNSNLHLLPLIRTIIKSKPIRD